MLIWPTLRTLRFLRPEQMAHRLWRRARTPWFASPLYRPRRAPCLPRQPAPGWCPGDAEHGARIVAGTIRLVGLERPFARPFDWDAADMPLLWRFSLHYFDWLDDLAALGTPQALALGRAAVADWIARHRRIGGPAWHPYPVSLRLHAWLRHAEWLTETRDDTAKREYARAIDRHAAHLPRVLERDVGGNHVIKNLKALVAAGCLRRGHTDDGRRALAALEAEAARQVLPDGAHYERSPAYHLQVLGDLLDIRALLAEASPAWLDETIARMGRALAFFRMGDGLLPLFNDGEIGDPHALAAAARQLGDWPSPPRVLPDAGYARLASRDTIVVFDAGPCCPDDLPAHAHADTLAFEMSSAERRIVVNCGTYAYQDARRNLLRGTPAHSTADVDGRDSAEVYGTFRLGRRPRRVNLQTGEKDGRTFAEGSHDGYRHLGVSHTRRLEVAGDGALHGTDTFDLAARSPRDAHLHFHLHPDVRVEERGERGAVLLSGEERWCFGVDNGSLRVAESVYAARFYALVPTSQLVVDVAVDAPSVSVSWFFRRM